MFLKNNLQDDEKQVEKNHLPTPKHQLHQILLAAIKMRASDVYFLPEKGEYSIMCKTARGRSQLSQLPFALAEQIINILKYHAQMNLSEKRRPQLGAWQFETNDETIFCRLASVGTFLNHQAIVVRLIYRSQSSHNRWLLNEQWQKMTTAAKRRGLLLFSGPMGSGKTSAMYHLARQLLPTQVLAIEDPVEIYEPDFLQLQVNAKAQMDYADLLKVALRLNPDVFIIGEIRDEYTAKVAVNAALSGHVVFSSVHAQSVYGVFWRLLNLGISQEELRQTVTSVTYQRLLPTTDGQVGGLFDFLDVLDVDWKTLSEKHHTMSDDWSDNLEKCLAAKQITLQTAEAFRYG